METKKQKQRQKMRRTSGCFPKIWSGAETEKRAMDMTLRWYGRNLYTAAIEGGVPSGTWQGDNRMLCSRVQMLFRSLRSRGPRRYSVGVIPVTDLN